MPQVTDELSKNLKIMKVNFIKGPMLDRLRQQIYIDFVKSKTSQKRKKETPNNQRLQNIQCSRTDTLMLEEATASAK